MKEEWEQQKGKKKQARVCETAALDTVSEKQRVFRSRKNDI